MNLREVAVAVVAVIAVLLWVFAARSQKGRPHSRDAGWRRLTRYAVATVGTVGLVVLIDLVRSTWFPGVTPYVKIVAVIPIVIAIFRRQAKTADVMTSIAQ